MHLSCCPVGLQLSLGVPITSPQLRHGARASPACTKQMVKHGLTRSEINLHFASKSHNHLIILGIGVEQAPGSCSLLGHFAWQDGGRELHPVPMLLRGPVSLVGLPNALLLCRPLGTVSGRRWWERTQACGSSTSASHPPRPAVSRFDLAPALPASCRGRPGETHPRAPSHSPGTAQEQTQPSDSQLPPVRGTGVELDHGRWVMPLCIPHKSWAASAPAPAAAAPAPRLAFMGEETGGNLAFLVARAAGGPKFLHSWWQGPHYQHAWAVCWKRAAVRLGDPTLPSFPGSRSL